MNLDPEYLRQLAMLNEAERLRKNGIDGGSGLSCGAQVIWFAIIFAIGAVVLHCTKGC